MTGQRYWLGDCLLAALMMIDMNDIQAVHEVKARILEYVNAWKNFKKRMPSGSSAGPTRPSRSAQGRSNVYSRLSGLDDVVFNYIIESRMPNRISFQKVMDKSRQVLHPFLALQPGGQEEPLADARQRAE